MKCQSLFSGKNKKNIINLSSAEFAHNMVSRQQFILHSNTFLQFETLAKLADSVFDFLIWCEDFNPF